MAMNRDTFDHGRRRALGLLGGLGAASLAGCCLPSQFGKQHIKPSQALTADAARILTLRAAGLRSSVPNGAIDVHSHFFNASDAAVTGYLIHSVGHTQSPEVQALLRAMQPVLNALTRFAPTAASEYRQLQELSGRMGLDAGAAEAQMQSLMLQRRQSIATELTREMRKQGADQVYLDALRRTTPASLLQTVPATLTEERVLADLDPFASRALLPGTGEHPAGVLQFMGCMLQERWMSLKTFQAGYGAQGIAACFGALVDFDHWYDCAGRSSLQDQVQLHGLMSRLSDGYLLPLVAYNPWTDLIKDGAALELVQRAVKDHGFIGVKIYPPVGFHPYGNASLPYPPGLKHPDLADLDARLEKLFDWCATHHIPVMAHTNSTMGADDDADKLGGPPGWDALIKKFSTAPNPPPVNLGHFGGAEDAQTWTQQFAALMGEKGGERFYGDLGYWDELRSCPTGAADCGPVKRLIEARAKFAGLDQRLMYGSDWFMLIQVDGWDRFPGEVANALRGHFDLDRLFHGNAMACFGLESGGPNRQRIIEHLGKVPAWMQA
jgi:predicted TIM-barrel fold metal-dependent hydrolase